MPFADRIVGAVIAFAAGLASAADQAHFSAAPFEDRRPRIRASALSMYVTAADHRRNMDVRAALELPLSDHVSLLGGLLLKHGSPKGADAFESAAWGVEAAVRRHPWDWMPGFFIQALAAVERSESVLPDQVARPRGVGAWSPFPAEHVKRAERWTYEGGLGYGYVWTWGRLSLEGQGILGPLLWTESRHARWSEYGGETQAAEEGASGWESLLRFRDLRIGLRF